MSRRSPAGRLLVGLTILVLSAGCTAGTSTTPTPTPPPPTSLSPAAGTTAAPAARTVTAPSASPLAVVATADVAYESANPLLVPGVLDIYAPTRPGPWPVVVMFHGSPFYNAKEELSEHARRVSERGFVVFVPSWGRLGGSTDVAPMYDQIQGFNSETACAVAFARANAAKYGGDPATMIVFGHSAGGNVAATLAFARPAPTAGCLGGTTLGAINTLVTWEGDWNLIDPVWDSAIPADPRIVDALTPWKYLAQHKDLTVVMLASQGSNDPGTPYQRQLDDPSAVASFFAVRDPSGVLRGQLDMNGTFADGSYSLGEEQQLLFSVLKAQGNPVSLAVMPDSTHDEIAGKGWSVFLAAFAKAAA